MAAFVVGFIIAFIRQWKLSLALSSIIPMIAITGGLMNLFISKYMQESLKHVAEGGSIAEEVISTIRTSHAFGSQNVLHSLYNAHVLKARAVDLKGAVWQGGALGVMFFVIYASYALAFQFGTTLINSGEGTIFKAFPVFLMLTCSLQLRLEKSLTSSLPFSSVPSPWLLWHPSFRPSHTLAVLLPSFLPLSTGSPPSIRLILEG